MKMDRFSSSLLLLLLAAVPAAACGDDDDSHDDDGDGTNQPDASVPDGGGTPDAATPDGGPLPDATPGDDAAPDFDAAPEVDAAPPGPGLVWVHGDMITNNRNQLAAVSIGAPLPAVPTVVLPASDTGTLATFQSFNSGAYDISSNGQRVTMPADIDVPDQFDLYAASVDGTNLIRVFAASGLADVGKARFSPDGTRIAFTADLETDGVFGAYVVPSNAPDATPLLVSPAGANDDVDDLVWSADSSFIMVTGDFTEAGFFELLITDVTQTNPTPVTLVSRAEILSTVAPAGVIQPIQGRGGSVLFKGRIAADDAIRLHRVATTGGSPVSVLPQSEIPRTDGTTIATIGSVGLSPDGNQIAFGADETLNVYDLWAMPVSGGEPPTRLTTGLVPPGGENRINPDFGQPLKWRPDGLEIAFLANYGTLSKNEPFVAPLDGSGQRKLATIGPADPNADAEAVGWSPDGTQLYLVADHATPNQIELFLLDPALADQEPTPVLAATSGGDLRGDITVSQ
ncbi:MAG TPA: hypothetical protein VK698_34465 [Kofleriaceae bacterium]|nr:hypothetical protein [Kofleriaceae bacterium]